MTDIVLTKGKKVPPKYNQWVVLFGITLPLIIFSILTAKISQVNNGLPWEVDLLLRIHHPSPMWLEKTAFFITHLGRLKGLLLLLLPLSTVLIYRKQWHLLTYVLVTILGSSLLNAIVKVIFHRFRPKLWELSYSPPPDLSFPSGHAMGSMTFVMVLLILTWETRWRILTIILGTLFVLIIAWTRLYLGFHFPSDILGGWLLAIAWTTTISLFLRK
jgi:undecaprenyl-diphosphatase